MRRSFGVALAVGALLVGGLSSPTTAASVQPTPMSGFVENAAFEDCPAGFVCLWENASFEGAMFRTDDCCSWINLAPYLFNNLMSSWRNRKARDARVAEFADGDGDKLCLNDHSSDGWVGNAWNDRASSVKIFNDSNIC